MKEMSCYCERCLTGEEFKGIQHVVGSQSLSVMKLQVLLTADLLFVSTIGLLPTVKVPGTLDKFSKLMNRMKRLRFPS